MDDEAECPASLWRRTPAFFLLSGAGTVIRIGLSRSSGLSKLLELHQVAYAQNPHPSRKTSSSSMRSDSVKYRTVACGIVSETSRRTALPKRRSRSDSFILSRRSERFIVSNLHIGIARHAKQMTLAETHAGETQNAGCIDQFFEETNFCPLSPTGTRRGTTGGTLIRTNRGNFPWLFGSLGSESTSTVKPIFRLRLAINGNG